MYKVVISASIGWKLAYEFARTLGLTLQSVMTMNGYVEWRIVLPSYREAVALASMMYADGPDYLPVYVFVRPV